MFSADKLKQEIVAPYKNQAIFYVVYPNPNPNLNSNSNLNPNPNPTQVIVYVVVGIGLIGVAYVCAAGRQTRAARGPATEPGLVDSRLLRPAPSGCSPPCHGNGPGGPMAWLVGLLPPRATDTRSSLDQPIRGTSVLTMPLYLLWLF